MATTLDKLFEMGEYEDSFHPQAVSNYRQFLDGIAKDVPLDRLTDEDVKHFLSFWEYSDYEHGTKRLEEWLEDCLRDGEFYADRFPFWGTYGLKSLLLRAWQGKQEQERVLAVQRERDARARQAKIEEDARYKQAAREHEQYLKEINDTIEKFKVGLAKVKKPTIAYPPALAKYHPEGWQP